MERSNTVFIGGKPTLNCVLAYMTLFKDDQEDDHIKIRGLGTNRALDVIEVLRNRFMPDVEVTEISIDTEHLENRKGEGISTVSAIKIKP